MIDSAPQSLAGQLFLKMKINILCPLLLSAPWQKKKKALRNDSLMFWLFEPMFHPLMSWGDALHLQKVLKHVSVQKLPSSRYCYKLIYTNSLDAPSRWQQCRLHVHKPPNILKCVKLQPILMNTVWESFITTGAK